MVLIVDLAIHEKAKLSRDQFLSRVSSVQEIRGNNRICDEFLTIYIRSLETFMLLNYFQAAVTQGDFAGLNDHYRCYHAGIEIPDPLYFWFKKTSKDTILRQIICWLAALDNLGILPQEVMGESLYPAIHQEVQQVRNEFFTQHNKPYTSIDEDRAIYHAAALAYYGSIPPLLLWEPRTFLNSRNAEPSKWGAYGDFDISIGRYYFTRRDWECVVIKGEEDTLIRAESSRDHWEKIKHQFVAGATNKDNVFSLFSSSAEKGRVYLIRAHGTSHYKIGYTNGDPNQRLASLQTGNSHALVLVGSFSCTGKSTERLLHDFFAGACLYGEWFNLSDSEAQEVLDENWRAVRSIF